MLETVFEDVIYIIQSTFLQGDMISIGIAVGSILLAAIMMQRSGQIGSMTLLALTFFVAGGLVRTLLSPPPEELAGRVTGERAAQTVESGLAQFYDMNAGGVLAYFIGFMLVILVLFTVKSILRR